MGQIAIKYIEASILLLTALISDIKFYKIKNKITMIFVSAGLLTGFGFQRSKGVLNSFLGIVVPFILLFALYAIRMLGAGDIKLFCALGAIFGGKCIIDIMAYSFIAGGIISLVLMVTRRNAKNRFMHFCNYFKMIFLLQSFRPYTEFEEKTDKGKVRFAYAVFIGTFFFIFNNLFRVGIYRDPILLIPILGSCSLQFYKIDILKYFHA